MKMLVMLMMCSQNLIIVTWASTTDRQRASKTVAMCKSGHSTVGARHTLVYEGEDLDPSRVAHISWWQTVRVLSRPFGQKTSSQSHHQQGFGIEKRVTDIVVRELKRTKPGEWGVCMGWQSVVKSQLRRRLTCGLDTFGSWTSLNCGCIGLLMICQDSRFRSGTPQWVLTTQVLRLQCSSTRTRCAPRTSPSWKWGLFNSTWCLVDTVVRAARQ